MNCRVLKKLLSSREFLQLIKIEKSCEANQLRPEDICVDGKKLNMDEILLQSCPCPPKLKPGFYWYDKVSGYCGKVVGSSRVDFEPSDTDILYADGITSSNGLMYTDIQFPPSAYAGSSVDDDDQHETLSRCQLIRIHTKGLGENCKWLGMFEDVHIVIFSIAITDYNEYYEDTDGMTTNRMMEGERLFECIASHPSFQHTYFLLILSKFDLLEQKLDTAPLILCEWFDDYNPVGSRHPSNKTS